MKKHKIGIPELDQILGGGIPHNDLTVVSTPDDRIGNMILGHAIHAQLNAGETVLLISFEKKSSFFQNFQGIGIDFQPFYDSKQLLFFNFISNIRQKVGFLSDYRAILEEILLLSGEQKPSCLAIHQIDALLNLSNPHLIHLTCEKLAGGCRSKVANGITTLAQFTHYSDKTHHNLSIGLQKTAAGYIEVQQGLSQGLALELCVRKMPWFDYSAEKLVLTEQRVQQLLGSDSFTKETGHAAS